MRDDMEAGKYLFLSGRRQPEYESAIALVLARYRRSPGNLVSRFPNAVRRNKWRDLPEQVRRDLETAGVPSMAPDDFIWQVGPGRRQSSFGCGGIAILLLLILIGFTIAVYIVHFQLGT